MINRFRPHHIFCERFLKVEYPDRGSEFAEVGQKIKDILEKDDPNQVEISEGVDGLCRVCPDCRDDRCQNPQGDEDAVRKWDGIILKGLGVSYGEAKTSKEWRTLIDEKTPLKFCRTRCPWRSNCAVFEHN